MPIITRRVGGWLVLPALLLTAACADGDWEVTTNACDEDFGPGLYSWVDGMDTDGDNTINSDEFNAAFQDTVDEMDGRQTYEGFREHICSQPPYAP